MLSKQHQRPHRAPEVPQARPPQASWPAAARRLAPSPARLPGEDRHRAVPLDDRASRPAPIAVPLTGDHTDHSCPMISSIQPTTASMPGRTPGPLRMRRRSSVVAAGSVHERRAPMASIEGRPLFPLEFHAGPALRVGGTRGRRTSSVLGSAITEISPRPSASADAVIDNGKFGKRTIRFETGRLAKQAAGSARRLPRRRDHAAVGHDRLQASQDNFDFFPLTVDVEERMYAAGRIPGSFFRREGRPSRTRSSPAG